MGYTGEQKREYRRKWMQARREDAIAFLGSSCRVCGRTDNLEFDHIDKDLKSNSIQSLISGRWEVLELELRKCQLLCANCHKYKTKLENVVDNHGTHSRYTSGGCRCRPCKDAHNLATAEWRNRNKED